MPRFTAIYKYKGRKRCVFGTERRTMNTKTNHRFGIYLPLTILLSTVACTLRTVAAFLGVDQYGYFEAATLSSVSAWILISAILIMLTYPIAYAKRSDVLVRSTTPLTFIPSLLSALVMIFFVGEIGTRLYATLLLTDRILLLALTVLGVFSALFFFSLAVVESGISDKKASYGMVLVLLLGIYAASLYLNTDIPRNAHTELAEEMTLIALSLFFLYEIRISLDKPKQNLYVTFGFIAAMLCAYTAIPSLIYYIGSGTLLLSSLSVFLLILALFIFIIARLYLFNITPKNEACTMVRALADAANARAQAVSEVEALYAPAPLPDVEKEEGEIDIDTAEEADHSNEELPAEESTPSIAEEADPAPLLVEVEGSTEPASDTEQGVASEQIASEEHPPLAVEVEAEEIVQAASDSTSAPAHAQDIELTDASINEAKSEETGDACSNDNESAAQNSDELEAPARASAEAPTEEDATDPDSQADSTLPSTETENTPDKSNNEKGEENEENSGH